MQREFWTNATDVRRYVRGQHFGRHIDEAVEAVPGKWTQFTLLIYLSGGLAGGETVFYGAIITV